MDTTDSEFNIRQAEEQAGLRSQVQDVLDDCSILVHNTILRFQCFLTGDGATMLSTNHIQGTRNQ